MQYVWPLITGVVVGAIFALMDFPVPAPHNLGGLLGIAGIFVGFKAVGVLL